MFVYTSLVAEQRLKERTTSIIAQFPHTKHKHLFMRGEQVQDTSDQE